MVKQTHCRYRKQKSSENPRKSNQLLLVTQIHPSKDKSVADALSRVYKEISTYSFKYERQLPRLMTISTRRALRAKQVETEDPLVAKLAETGAEDPEYIEMLKAVQEADFNIPKESELKKLNDHKDVQFPWELCDKILVE